MLVSRQMGDRWSTHPDVVRATLRAWLGWWRDVLLVQVGLTARTAHIEPDQASDLERVARQVAHADARAAQARVQQTLTDLDTNVNARLALDLLLLRFPTLAEASSGAAR
jgi:hypothetical protein